MDWALWIIGGVVQKQKERRQRSFASGIFISYPLLAPYCGSGSPAFSPVLLAAVFSLAIVLTLVALILAVVGILIGLVLAMKRQWFFHHSKDSPCC